MARVSHAAKRAKPAVALGVQRRVRPHLSSRPAHGQAQPRWHNERASGCTWAGSAIARSGCGPRPHARARDRRVQAQETLEQHRRVRRLALEARQTTDQLPLELCRDFAWSWPVELWLGDAEGRSTLT